MTIMKDESFEDNENADSIYIPSLRTVITGNRVRAASTGELS